MREQVGADGAVDIQPELISADNRIELPDRSEGLRQPVGVCRRIGALFIPEKAHFRCGPKILIELEAEDLLRGSRDNCRIPV